MHHREPMNNVGFEQISVTASAASLTVPARARRAEIQVLTADIYYVEDGGTPSATNGMEAYNGKSLPYLDHDYRTILLNFKAIRQGSTNAKLNVNYYD